MQVFYTPSHNGIVPQVIDVTRINEKGEVVGMHSGETLERVALRYPGAQLGDNKTITLEKEAMMRTEPEPITEEQYIDALEILPPEDWQRKGAQESFKMCEYLSGRMTRIYAMVGNTYWSMVDLSSTKHSDIMDRVAKARELQGAT